MDDSTLTPELLAALDDEAWACRYKDNARGRAVATMLLNKAQPGSRGEALGCLHRAIFAASDGEAGLAAQMRAAAQPWLLAAGTTEEWCTARWLDALALRRAGQPKEALVALAEYAPDQTTPRGLVQAYQTYNIMGLCRGDLGDLDQSQRLLLQALAVAQRSDNLALEVNARANLGGFYYDVLSLDDARRNLERALELADIAPAPLVWFTAAINLMITLDAQGEVGAAMVIAEQILARGESIPPARRHLYMTKFAAVYLHHGDQVRAGEFLAEAARLNPQARNKIEFVWVETEYHHSMGDHALARAAAEAKIQGLRPDTEADLPYDAMRLYHAATDACEALGDFATALRYQKRVFSLYETLVGLSARARRITAEVEQELALTAWQRDEAQRRERATETERQELQRLNEALASANLAKTRFLAAASHDLRQPVHALGLSVDMLARRSLGEAETVLVQRIQASSASIQALLSELLDISKLDADAMQPTLTAVAVTDLLVQLEQEFMSVAGERELELRLRSADIWVESDAFLLYRILQNLVANALGYTKRGGVLISVRKRIAQVWIEVWDTGIGIEADHVPRVFEEFYQVDNVARDRRKGLGLGLAIVERLARILDVGLTLRSQPGKGTCVRLVLKPAEPVLLKQVVMEAAPTLPAGLRILVVDDNSDVRKAVLSLLQEYRAEVYVAADMAEAVAAATHFSADCLLLDWRLPDSDGLATLDRIRAVTGRSIPALILTGDALAADIARFDQAGVTGLVKPVSAPTLIAAIVKVLQRPG